jgi:hypothetical protein
VKASSVWEKQLAEEKKKEEERLAALKQERGTLSGNSPNKRWEMDKVQEEQAKKEQQCKQNEELLAQL